MAKRLFDILFAACVLILTMPLFVFAAVGIFISDPGPVLYRAKRAGMDGVAFVMYKFRTMRLKQDPGAGVITARGDSRVFRFGAFLRALKIDELPQFINVVKGDMSVVGPRPEDPSIVERWYTLEQRETLSVKPGIASPGSIYNYTHAERHIAQSDPERDYAENVLPVKLALELVYVRSAGFFYDLRIIARTVAVIVAMMFGRRSFADPPEMRGTLNGER